MNDDLADDARAGAGGGMFVGRDGLRAGWSLLLFVIMALLCAAGLFYLMVLLGPAQLSIGSGMSPKGAIVQELLSLAMVGIPALIMSRIEHRRFSRYGFRGPDALGDFGKGLLGGFALLSLLVALLWVSGGIAFDGVALSGGAAVGYAAVWLVAFLLVALFEEFAFRGYLQFTLARGVAGMVRAISPGSRAAPTIGFWTAATAFSIVLFALAHTSNGGETPMGILSVSLAGVILVFSLWWTGSLWWAVGFHCAWDWAQSYLYGVADSGMVSQGHLLTTHATGSPLLSGGPTGPEGSILVVPVTLIALVVIARTMPRRLPPVIDGEA
jgi:membrane protease YdiL (CAAX protease family)